MTLNDVFRLLQFWKLYPPAGDLISVLASCVGWESPLLHQFETNYDDAAARTADWFKDPARFFAK